MKEGESFGIVGESGCGKSTLARTVLGFESPRSGSVFFQGKDLYLTDKERLAVIKKYNDITVPKYRLDLEKLNIIEGGKFLDANAKKEDVIQKSDVKNLDVILSGPTPPNPAELLDKKLMQSFLEELHEDYKYIVIDTPPIGLVTDGLILMKHTHCV